jgi:hypothetical protein
MTELLILMALPNKLRTFSLQSGEFKSTFLENSLNIATGEACVSFFVKAQ